MSYQCQFVPKYLVNKERVLLLFGPRHRKNVRKVTGSENHQKLLVYNYLLV